MISIHPAKKMTLMLTMLLVLLICTMVSTVALAETDSTPPALEWSNPTNCQTDVPTPLEVVVCYFNENEFLDASKCNLEIITFKDSSGQDVLLDEEYGKKIQDNKLVITPKSFLVEDEIYTIDIPYGSIRDHAGNTSDAVTIKFSTGETNPCKDKPTVTTVNISEITGTSAILNGSIVENGGAAIDEYGFKWSTDQENWTTETVGADDLSGDFSYELTELTANIIYYIKAYAKNSEGTSYGDVMTFIFTDTDADTVISAPIDVRGAAGEEVQVPITLKSTGNIAGIQFDLAYDSSLLDYQETEAGSITSSPAFEVLSNVIGESKTRVFIYNPSNDANIEQGEGIVAILTFKVAGDAQPAESCPLILSGTEASNQNANIIDGVVAINGLFTVPDQVTPTPTPPVVKSNNASSITTSSAKLNGSITSNGGAPVTAYGFNWSSDKENWTTVVVGNSNFNGAFNKSLSGLNASTTYYYEAYATNEYGTTSGDVLEFKTSSASIGGGGGGGGGVPDTSSSKDIDAEDGGSLSYEGATVDIPAGALEADAKFTIKKLSSSDSDDVVPSSLRVKLCGYVYEITTDGSTNFKKNITICLPYDVDCIAEGEYAIVHYYDEITEQWSKLNTNTKYDGNKNIACVEVDHLTKFAVFSTKVKVINLTIGQLQAVVDGNSYTLDAAPFVTEANRTLVPIRFVSEALGAKVEWDADNRQVIIEDGDVTIVLPIETASVIVNGQTKALDAPATINNSRTFVPLRFVSEALGAQVDYYSTTQGITITR